MSEAGDTIGTMATGTLIAREIERAHAGQPAIGHDIHEACANCGTRRQGAYCHACGQAGHVHRNLFSLVHDLAHGVFHFEGKIWNTLPMLAWRPGELTRRYVLGERAKFVSPMALFLFSVFLLFSIVPNIGSHSVKNVREQVAANKGLDARRANFTARLGAYQAARATIPPGAARDELDAKITTAKATLVAIDLAKLRSGDKAGAAGDKARAERIGESVNTGLPFVDYAIRHAAENPTLTAYKIKTYAYKYSWALIPISVPFIWLLFAFRRDVGGYDHAIFAIYSLSFMSLGFVVLALLSWIGVPTSLLVLAGLSIPPVHMYRQLKGAYLLGRVGALWRTFALLNATAVTSALFLSFLVYMGSG